MFRSTKLLLAMVESLQTEIDNASVPDVLFCGVVPGDGAAADYAGKLRGQKQGMAWVRMMSMYPASGINVVNDAPNNCGSALGMDIEVGMMRPIKVVDSRSGGKLPTAEDYMQSAELQDEDALVMYRAIKGCSTFLDLENIVGQYQPLGPMGGVVGGTWGAAVLLD